MSAGEVAGWLIQPNPGQHHGFGWWLLAGAVAVAWLLRQVSR